MAKLNQARPVSSTPAAPEPREAMRAYVRWAIRRGALLWALALALAVPALIRTVSLYVHLKSDIEELLPRAAPSVSALDELRTRMPGLRYLGILVDTGKPENLGAAERFLDDLGARVHAYPPALVKSVKTGIGEERAFFERNAPLYADLDDLKKVKDRIEEGRDRAVTKELGIDFADDDTGTDSDAAAVDFRDIEAKYRAREKGAQRFDGDRFSSRAKGLSLLLIEVAELTTGADLGNELFRRVERDIADLGSTDRYAPGMRVGFTGDIAIDHEELAALVSDLAISSVVVVLLVLFVVIGFYRWWGSVPALLLPLSLATVYAFALVTIGPSGITHLNSNTAFLASVIIGNGVNFGVILLARYVEERRRGDSIEDALVKALWGTRTGTLVAALAASAAYGSLAFTQFRGFKQFGVIGGVGMVTSWGSAFLLGPALIARLDRHGASVRIDSAKRPPMMARLATLVTRHSMPIALVATALSVASVLQLRKLDRSFIEYDFSQLRRSDSRISGEGYWGGRMDDLLGRYLTPLVMLTDGPEEAAELAGALRAAASQPPLDGVIDSVVSVLDVVPRDQAEKIEVTRTLAKDLTPAIRAKLTAEQRALVERYLTRTALSPLAPSDLPASLTTGLRERDGSFDRAVLIYPRPSQATWQGPAILRMTQALRGVAEASALPGGRPARLAGSIPLSADIISSIEKDGPVATALALLAVVLLVLAIFRFSLATPLILGSLLVAVLWLTAGIMAFGIKINFCNFIAFPITFGIGVDYAVNVMARYRESRSHDVVAAIKSTGGAVALCSLTTMIGYGSLLFAQNRALFLFGVVAVLGEVVCLITAVVVLPAVLTLVRREAAPSTLAEAISRRGSKPS
ncbi:MAG TPA: MMPL family transporter [Polyangiaceae bacterium]|nr:MMPL family transporter [Polyangiaceae bacterium]